ncbi:ribosomal protein L34-domain-containing protein [Aspergillus unguis]
MLCLRCRAIPSAVRTATSSVTKQSTATATPLFSLSRTSQLRSFSLATSTPTRPAITLQQLQSLQSPITSALSQLHSQSQNQQVRSFSASASLAGWRPTFRPSRRVQKRRHGFLSRLRTKNGRKILTRRKTKGRNNLSW